MTARTILYSQEQMRSFDFVQAEHDMLLALAQSMQDVMGATTTVVSGLTPTQSGPSLTINIAAGSVYQLAAADGVAAGAIPQDLTNIMQQGVAAAQQLTLSTSGISSGQSRWTLVQAQFQQQDAVRAADPNGGVLLYFNAANPASPLQGPGGLGTTQNTVRAGALVLSTVNGSAATTGTEVPPNPTGGWVPLFLIDLAFGQTTIITAQILTAGPSVGTGVPSNYPAAPFLAGMLNSHHNGTSGQAPKIKLTSEVQGVLPMANLPASSSNTNAGLSAVYEFAGNPNTNVAGVAATATTPPDMCWDRTNNLLYVCTTTGNAAAAVWTKVATDKQLQRQIFTASGTFTTPAGTTTLTKYRFRLIGGGATGTNIVSGGSGAEAWSTQSGFAAGSAITVTVGGVGGNTSISGGGATTVTAGGASGATKGSPSGGFDVGGGFTGQDGGVCFNGSVEYGPAGGSTSLGEGGLATLANSATGFNGLNSFGFGSGGGGASPISGTGGIGSPGIAIVEWIA